MFLIKLQLTASHNFNYSSKSCLTLSHLRLTSRLPFSTSLKTSLISLLPLRKPSYPKNPTSSIPLTPASHSSLQNPTFRLIRCIPYSPPTKKIQPPQFPHSLLPIRNSKSNLLISRHTNPKSQNVNLRAVRLALRKIQPPELLRGFWQVAG
jgi:hypothetical protein